MTARKQSAVVSQKENMPLAEKAQAEEVDLRVNKAARNKRKKENAKKNKQDVAAKLKKDEDVLAAAAARAAKEKLALKKDKHLQDLSASHSIITKASSIRGLGIFALKTFTPGSIILRESPLLPPVKNNSTLLKEASFNLSSFCKQAAFLALHSHCSCKNTPCVETRFMRVSSDNSFTLPNSKHSCIYEVASRLNHSCITNTTIGFTSNQILVIRASRVIKEGEEITIQYSGYKGGDKKYRQSVLRKKYGFICRCTACSSKQSLPFIVEPLQYTTEPNNSSAKTINKPTHDSLAASHDIVDYARHMTRLLPSALEVFMQTSLPSIVEEMRNDGPYDEFNEDLADFALDCWGHFLRAQNAFGLSNEIISKHVYSFRKRFDADAGKMNPIQFIKFMFEAFKEIFEVKDV